MYEHDIDNCPRCLGSHVALKFRTFKIPAREHNCFAMCPKTKEPIVALASLATPPPSPKALAALKEGGEKKKDETPEATASPPAAEEEAA